MRIRQPPLNSLVGLNIPTGTCGSSSSALRKPRFSGSASPLPRSPDPDAFWRGPVICQFTDPFRGSPSAVSTLKFAIMTSLRSARRDLHTLCSLLAGETGSPGLRRIPQQEQQHQQHIAVCLVVFFCLYWFSRQSLLINIFEIEFEDRRKDRVKIWSRAVKPETGRADVTHRDVRNLHFVRRPKVGHKHHHKYTIKLNLGNKAADLVRILLTTAHTEKMIESRDNLVKNEKLR